MILLSATAFALSVISCSDFLNQTSESSLDGKNIFSNYEYAEGTIANIYNVFGMKNYRARAIWYGYNTDIEYYNSSNSTDNKADIATYNAGVDNGQLSTTGNDDLWSYFYTAIERANLAIEGIRSDGDLTDSGMKQLLGEALTLRALFYVDLINMWGDVPARFTSVTEDNMYIAREDRDVIYKQLIADLQEAENLCAWPNEITTTETVERVNKAFVKGLLARVCMQASGYAQRADGQNRLSTDEELSKSRLYPIALQTCKDVMDKEGVCVALKPNFEDIFNNNGISGDIISAGSESLFEIGYINTESSRRGRIMMTFGIKHKTADDFTAMKNKGSDVGPMPSLYFDYSVKDKRRDVTCCPYQWNKGKQELQPVSCWSFGKWRYEWTNRFIPSGNDDGINRLYMRYADIVLMRAELENELNGPSAAAPYLKKIRERAFATEDKATEVDAYISSVSNSKEAMFNAIVDERALEFAGELVRKADLIRWGKLKSKMDEQKAKMQALANLQDYDKSHPYSQLSGHVYYKMVDFPWMRGENSYTATNAALSIYGLNYGENGAAPDGYTEYTDSEGKTSEWIKEGILDDVIKSVYVQDPDKRQYWPIFSVNLNDNPNLVNYEWY